MIKRTKLATAIKLAALSAAGAAMLSTTPVFAQEGGSTIEEVMVTGSRIARDEFSSSSPISTFDASDMKSAGVTGVDEFLKDVPAFTGYQMGTSTNNGSDSGQKKIDMRGLGFNRTLVLINGKRQIGDVTGDGAVDLNTVPSAMIKRVEVLKDGASTVYGSDALAGVVNIILHDDFEGFQVTGDWGQGTEDGQATNQALSFLGGAAGDKGNVVFSMEYNNQDEMLQAERPWATESLYPLLNDNGVFEAVGSGSSNSRKIRVAGVGNRILDADTGIGREFDNTTDLYNFAPVNALITPNERYQFGFNGKLKITDDVEAYAEALYTKRTSQQRLAPDASFAVVNDFATPNNGAQWNDFVPANNPYNPYGVNPNNDENLSGLDVRVNRRFVESGGRLFRQSASTFRVVTGFQGNFADKVDWDVSYTYAENEVLDETKNYGRFDRWATAVDPVACAADDACAAVGVLNPFGDYGSITDAQMAYLSTGSLKDQYFGKLDLFSINLSGEMFDMSGGTAGWAVGFENRHESGFFSPDEFISGGLTTGGAGDPLEGSFAVKEVYGEIYLPVMDNLSVNASARYSDYDTVGDSTTYKIGADWAPIESVRLRGSYSTGFRAPNIAELNQGDAGDFPIVEPICEFADRRLASGDISQTAYDNCVALGIDTTDTGEVGYAWQSYQETAAPATPLTPEESTSINFGIVYTPEFLPGLQLSADYWDIQIDNVIGSDDINDLMSNCMNSVGLSAASCSVFSNDIGDTSPFYDAANNPTYDALGNPTGFGAPFPSDVYNEFGNLGKLATNGWDFEARYFGELSAGAITGYNLSWSATWQEKYERDYPLSGAVDLVGTANGFAVFPEWRYNISAGLEGENWTATWKMRYIDETEDALRPASITDDAVAEAMLYHDLIGTYTWENIDITMGINNLTDEDAPRFHSAFNANTEPGMYDVIGRRFFTSVTVKF